MSIQKDLTIITFLKHCYYPYFNPFLPEFTIN